MAQRTPAGKGPARWVIVTVLLTVAIAGTLWVPLYARSVPGLGDFPFFYWYQLVWVPMTGLLCWMCYLLLRANPVRGRRGAGRGGAHR
jgi:hypothetical protein